MPNYWVVGAMWGGRDDQFEKFIREGYWDVGWKDEDEPKQANLRNQIKPGDRIAIKKMLGPKNPDNIAIRALGIVKDIYEEDKRIYVNWLVDDLERIVPSKGAYDTVRGPFKEDDEWVKEVFHI